MESARYGWVRVRVMRAGPYTAHVSVPTFAGGQILVPVQTFDLMSATGLAVEQLADVELMAMVNLSATVDTGVDPHGWRIPDGGERPGLPRPASPPQQAWDRSA
ncbi:hypothetical protein [Streptomyces similanensis]|uniref:Uncharacterized protein n=1 Tax=Streptomyces similanensis TaxID=1274988 RepID=A0ABP9L7U1_9ACTN